MSCDWLSANQRPVFPDSVSSWYRACVQDVGSCPGYFWMAWSFRCKIIQYVIQRHFLGDLRSWFLNFSLLRIKRTSTTWCTWGSTSISETICASHLNCCGLTCTSYSNETTSRLEHFRTCLKCQKRQTYCDSTREMLDYVCYSSILWTH